MKGPSLYMSLNDYTTYRTGKIWRRYPEEIENINKNAFRQNLIKKYKLKNNAEFQQLFNRTEHMLDVTGRTSGTFVKTKNSAYSTKNRNIIRRNDGQGLASFLTKRIYGGQWEPVNGSRSYNDHFFKNNRSKIVRIHPRLANEYPELQSYYIKKPNNTLANGLYMRPTNYYGFRQSKVLEHKMVRTARRLRGFEAMKPRLLASLARAQRKSRIRNYFTFLKENMMQKPNSPLKRKLPNTTAEKARKKAAANKEAANKAARNARNAELTAARNRSRRLREENEARRLASAGSHRARTWKRTASGSVTRK